MLLRKDVCDIINTVLNVQSDAASTPIWLSFRSKHNIGEVATVKYLGHVMANDMTDDADMMRQRRQIYALGNVLSRRFHIMCSIEVKNTLFRSFCTPMYTCQLWWNFSVQSMHKFNVAYNNAFRCMHHLPTYCSASLMFAVNRVRIALLPRIVFAD